VQVIKILIVLFGVFVTLPLLLKTSVVLFQMTDYEIYACTIEKISFLLNHTNSTVNVIVYAGRRRSFEEVPNVFTISVLPILEIIVIYFWFHILFHNFAKT